MEAYLPSVLLDEPQGCWACIVNDTSCLPVTEHGAACMQHAPEPPIKDPAHEDASKADALRIYSMEDVEKHDTRDSAWFVHKGQVGCSHLNICSPAPGPL